MSFLKNLGKRFLAPPGASKEVVEKFKDIKYDKRIQREWLKAVARGDPSVVVTKNGRLVQVAVQSIGSSPGSSTTWTIGLEHEPGESYTSPIKTRTGLRILAREPYP